MWKCFVEGSVDSKQGPPASQQALYVSRNNGQHDADEEDDEAGDVDDGGEGWHPGGGEPQPISWAH